MTGSVNVSRKFMADFDQVTKHYGLSEAELIEAKQAARDDLEAAISTFAALAKEIA